ncbi:hypothetical protein [Mariniphaga anaerophila]|uniref:hypothetical protein n=1 Tax=Mariniphaga anaerophila TaxID=1484053 RepID=UPI001114D168|nr:hypothetical protein [Mariniphaga anaerophila]
MKEIEFDRNNPEFCVVKVDKSDFDKDTFSTNNIYYIGTREGCGCKFGIQEIPSEIINEAKQLINAKKELTDKIRQFFEYESTIDEIDFTVKESKDYSEDTQKLYTLITGLCNKNDKVEFYGCEADHEKKKYDEKLTIDLKEGDLYIDFDKFWDLNIRIDIKK